MEKRKIQDVIDAIIVELPEEYDHVKSRLLAFKQSTDFCPSEGMRHWWKNMMIVLNTEIPFPPETDWQKNIYEIVTTKNAKDITT